MSASNRRLPLQHLAYLEDLHFVKITLRTALQKEGYSRRIARAKPLLSESQKERRLQWAYDYLEWSDRQWSRVIWTDEASIRCGHFGQVYITRQAGEEYTKDCLVARFRKYSACMIWGAISVYGPQKVIIFEKGKVDGERYRTLVLTYHRSLKQYYNLRVIASFNRVLFLCRIMLLSIRHIKQWNYLMRWEYR